MSQPCSSPSGRFSHHSVSPGVRISTRRKQSPSTSLAPSVRHAPRTGASLPRGFMPPGRPHNTVRSVTSQSLVLGLSGSVTPPRAVTWSVPSSSHAARRSCARLTASKAAAPLTDCVFRVSDRPKGSSLPIGLLGRPRWGSVKLPRPRIDTSRRQADQRQREQRDPEAREEDHQSGSMQRPQRSGRSERARTDRTPSARAVLSGTPPIASHSRPPPTRRPRASPRHRTPDRAAMYHLSHGVAERGTGRAAKIAD